MVCRGYWSAVKKMSLCMSRKVSLTVDPRLQNFDGICPPSHQPDECGTRPFLRGGPGAGP